MAGWNRMTIPKISKIHWDNLNLCEIMLQIPLVLLNSLNVHLRFIKERNVKNVHRFAAIQNRV